MYRPFFSIVIPTYNRASYLKIAIRSILRQDFDNYEIVISDNASADNTAKVCQSFKDKRIRYVKNKVNIGFNRNLYKVIKLALGNYIFILGDDDFILKKTTLSSAFYKIKKNRYGLIRLRFIYSNGSKKLFSTYFNNNKELILRKKSTNIDLLKFLYDKAIFGFISGLVFKNINNVKIVEIEKTSKNNFEISNFWISFLFPAVKLAGACIDLENPIIAKWPNYKNPQFYNVKSGKLPNERIWKLFFQYLNKTEKKTWIKREINGMTHLLPSIKYYSNNKNLFLYSKRMLEVDKFLYKNWFFYFSLLVAFFMPNFLWRFLRKIFHNQCFVKDKTIYEEIKEFEKEKK